MFNKPKCDICGYSIDIDDYIVYDGQMVCSDCANEHLFQCEYCYEYAPIDDKKFAFISTNNEGVIEIAICPDCLDNYFNYCPNCECYVDDNLFDKEKGLCDECLVEIEEINNEN